MNSVIPNRFLFDFEFRLHHRKKPPVIDGTDAGWTDAERLPALCELEDQAPFAPVWACWNQSGLYVACQVPPKKLPLRCDPKAFWKGDNLRICTDMRDARQNRRATRFCQQFFILPKGGGPNAARPVAGSAKIHRAREDAPPCSSESGASDRIRVASRMDERGYFLEAHLPAACLAGFDPTEHNRIGFYYMLEDREHGQQYLTVGDDLNWHIDPSTWATAVLEK